MRFQNFSLRFGKFINFPFPASGLHEVQQYLHSAVSATRQCHSCATTKTYSKGAQDLVTSRSGMMTKTTKPANKTYHLSCPKKCCQRKLLNEKPIQQTMLEYKNNRRAK